MEGCLLLLSQYATPWPSLTVKILEINSFNTGLPVRALVICWGPYSLLCAYAAVESVAFISPKILMIPAVIAKSSPMVNALIYALGNENYRGGIWQFLTGQKMEKMEVDNKMK
ncbi:hypothetical protein JRQ81_017369 [Phrynocephalus forsythii]|uniref:Uncharacterized protein n=1 Tax=Phrynocephalus forsythii TaxID=171643 RepID=A0A9Q0XQQ2_9SAUR|nr:hypothetical protein JRQ81_017369 [Phrynocephalus forsythii]